MGNNLKAYHLRGKHGKVGRLEGSKILRRTICEENMEKVGRLEWKTILRRTICEGNMDKVATLSGK